MQYGSFSWLFPISDFPVKSSGHSTCFIWHIAFGVARSEMLFSFQVRRSISIVHILRKHKKGWEFQMHRLVAKAGGCWDDHIQYFSYYYGRAGFVCDRVTSQHSGLSQFQKVDVLLVRSDSKSTSERQNNHWMWHEPAVQDFIVQLTNAARDSFFWGETNEYVHNCGGIALRSQGGKGDQNKVKKYLLRSRNAYSYFYRKTKPAPPGSSAWLITWLKFCVKSKPITFARNMKRTKQAPNTECFDLT